MKISAGFSVSKKYKGIQEVGSLYQILIRQKRNNLYAIAIVNKDLVKRIMKMS